MPDSSGSIDLSKVSKTGPTETSLDSLSPEEQEALEKIAERVNAEPEGTPVRTAFLVTVARDGSVDVHLDLDFDIVRDVIPSVDDIYGATQVIAKDIQAEQSGFLAAQAFQVMAQQQMQAMQNQRIASQINLQGH